MHNFIYYTIEFNLGKIQMSLRLSLPQEIFGVSVVIVAIALLFYLDNRAKKGKVPYIRRLPALDGLDYAINRAGELKKPVYCELGGTLTGTDGVMLSAALGMLPYIARRCAKDGIRLIVGLYAYEVAPLIRSVLDSAALAEGKERSFFPNSDILFLVSENAFYPIHIIEFNDCRVGIAIGRISLQALSVAQANKARGCIDIQGTAFINQIHAIGLLANYSLIAEDFFAGSAVLSGESEGKVTMRMEDIIKGGILVLLPIMYAMWRLGIRL